MSIYCLMTVAIGLFLGTVLIVLRELKEAMEVRELKELKEFKELGELPYNLPFSIHDYLVTIRHFAQI